MYLVDSRTTKCFSNLRSCSNPLASIGSVLMDRVPIKDIYQHKSMKWVNGKRKGLSANIFSLELESSDLPVRLFVSHASEEMHDLVIRVVHQSLRIWITTLEAHNRLTTSPLKCYSPQSECVPPSDLSY